MSNREELAVGEGCGVKWGSPQSDAWWEQRHEDPGQRGNLTLPSREGRQLAQGHTAGEGMAGIKLIPGLASFYSITCFPEACDFLAPVCLSLLVL